jgi:hypothetical protein
LSPLAMQQCGVQPSASAEPYNAYTGEAGKGEQSIYSKPTNEQMSTLHSQPTKEGFMCGPTGGIGGACSSRDYPPDAAANSAGYVSQGGDYNYYCKAMNVCPKVMPSMEAFTAGPPTPPGERMGAVWLWSASRACFASMARVMSIKKVRCLLCGHRGHRTQQCALSWCAVTAPRGRLRG